MTNILYYYNCKLNSIPSLHKDNNVIKKKKKSIFKILKKIWLKNCTIRVS